MATAAGAVLLQFLYDSDNSTADHQSAGSPTGLYIGLAFICLGLIIALICFLRAIWLQDRQNFNLTATQGVELVNGRGRFDTSRPRQESSGYSLQMTVVSPSIHLSVVHAINSNGARDDAVVAGISESTSAGNTTTVDALCNSEYRAGEGLHVGSSGETTERMICLGEITDGQIVRFLPECCHVFHVQRIDVWLTDQVSCPLCRRAV